MPITWRSCTGCSTLIPSGLPNADPASRCPVCGAGLAVRPAAWWEDAWFLARGKQKVGPMNLEQLRQVAAAGRLRPSDMVLLKGHRKWAPAASVAGLFPSAPGPARPAATAMKPAAPRVRLLVVVGGTAAVGLLVLLVYFVWFGAGGPNAGKPQPAPEMKPQEVTALARPSVALLKNRVMSGSGFLVDGGLVVTNSHVVATDMVAALTVTFPSSDLKDQPFQADLTYEDRMRDLAVLRLRSRPALPPLRLSSAPPAEGEDVLAIGSPGVYVTERGLSENAADKGTLSNPNFHSSQFNGANRDMRYIQHSAKINHGNSGGPLLDMHAEVIGVNVIMLDALGLDGVKLAIPADELQVALGKAADRDAAQVARAALAHDACSAAQNLEEAVGRYRAAAAYCRTAAAATEKRGGDTVAGYVAACRAVSVGQTDVGDPVAYRLRAVEPEWADITDLLAGSALDPRLRDKLRRLRDVYLDAKNLYESPPSLEELDRRWSAIQDSYPKLQEGIDAEFPSVF